MAQWFWRRRFLKVVNLFSLFPNYLPLEKGVALRLNKIESPSPKDALCQVWLKLAPWFWRRRFLKVVNLSLLFPNYLPFWIGLALHLNKFESPLPWDTLYQVWLKLAPWFWRRRSLIVVNLFLLFPNYLPFWIGLALHLKKPESPLPRDSFYQIWLKLVQWFWRRILKYEKVTDGRTHRQTDGHTTDEW